MYRRCIVRGCHTHVSATEPHHLIEWEHGGLTDIEALVPVCKHHHDVVHARGWQLALDPARRLIVTKDGHTIMTTGPPVEHWA